MTVLPRPRSAPAAAVSAVPRSAARRLTALGLLLALTGTPLPALAAPTPANPAPTSNPTPTSNPAPTSNPTPTASPAPTASPGPPAPGAVAALTRRVSAALAASGASVAAAVDVEGYGPVVRTRAWTARPPASTQKSFTALSALLALGPQAVLTTEVAVESVPALGRLEGGLWLVAGGDPTLTSASLRGLARQVRQAGVTTVAGDLLLDDSRYDARRTAAGWKASFVPGQSGPLSAMALDRNSWRRDRAFLADPALPAATRFRDLLRAEGVTVTGTVRRAPRPPSALTLAQHASAPLSELVRRVLKDSDNFSAELLLKEVGRSSGVQGSTTGGLRTSTLLLSARGVTTGAGADGSGLSSLDRQTPAAQLALLRAAEASPVAEAFRTALPVGCVDGTLRRRFCGTPAASRVHAKTGTLSGVRALAGYTTTAGGRRVHFALQLTGVRDGARALRAMDRAVVLLASERG